MGVIELKNNVEQAEAGEIRDLELIAARYTGDHSSLAPRGALNTQGKWPGTAPLNQGVWYFAVVPHEGLPYLENRDDIEIAYADDRERFAEALLTRPRLPDNLFGHTADDRLWEQVEEKLGVENPMEGGSVRQQLQAIAGVEEDEAAESDEDDGRVSTLTEEYTREELKEVVKAVREDPDDYNLQGSNSHLTPMAEWLADQDDETVNEALQDVAADEGGDA